ncbi:hypothetical protein [uncultured Selenomonas sp.]|jgi:hypothetical protein|uniref:hypothetical protein n=1 Tax=uncultured Selenomonas sp. TaxID=159275 RepID=UPI00263224F4|nr:hypothetical protein [uncultured Selenomonas sp.]
MARKNAENIRQQLKRTFKGYTRITRKIRQELSGMGFVLEIGKTHAKVYYGVDRSHFVTISKTASDWRTGLNICSQINALLSANV